LQFPGITIVPVEQKNWTRSFIQCYSGFHT